MSDFIQSNSLIEDLTFWIGLSIFLITTVFALLGYVSSTFMIAGIILMSIGLVMLGIRLFIGDN